VFSGQNRDSDVQVLHVLKPSEEQRRTQCAENGRNKPKKWKLLSAPHDSVLDETPKHIERFESKVNKKYLN
jgi:hypothetical protein